MNLEFWTLDGIQTLRTPAGDVLMPFITSFGNGGVIWIVLTVILLLIPKTRKTGLILGAALILDGILCNLLLKNLMRRIRPCDIKDAVRLLIPYPSDYSFPSGHTAVSFAAASALAFSAVRLAFSCLAAHWLLLRSSRSAARALLTCCWRSLS